MSPITYTEIANFFYLLKIEAEPIEVEMIKLFDSVAMAHSQKQQEKNNKNKKK